MTRLQAQNRNLRLTVELPDPKIHVLTDPRWAAAGIADAARHSDRLDARRQHPPHDSTFC